jgi:branched-chain amino acid transport system substrate-binding protein
MNDYRRRDAKIVTGIVATEPFMRQSKRASVFLQSLCLRSQLRTTIMDRRSFVNAALLGGIGGIAASSPLSVLAQSGSSDAIVIGQSGPLTGPIGPSNKEALSGAQLVFDIANKVGGINGRPIKFEVLDDGQDAKRAAENTRILIEEKNALALFMFRTSPTVEAALPVSEKARVPFLFPQVGPQVAYDKKFRLSFTLRAPYRLEAAKAVELARRLGNTRLGIVTADDNFGRDATAGAEEGMKIAKVNALFIEKFDNKTVDVSKSLLRIREQKPQAVLVFSNARAASLLIKQARAQELNPLFITLSNNSAQAFIDDLGDVGRGVAITQVFPSPTASGISIEFGKVLASPENKANIKATYATLQGYLSAKLLVEAMRAAGRNLNRETLVSALRKTSVRAFDFRIDFNNGNHGSDFVELSMIGKGGKMVL